MAPDSKRVGTRVYSRCGKANILQTIKKRWDKVKVSRYVTILCETIALVKV